MYLRRAYALFLFSNTRAYARTHDTMRVISYERPDLRRLQQREVELVVRVKSERGGKKKREKERESPLFASFAFCRACEGRLIRGRIRSHPDYRMATMTITLYSPTSTNLDRDVCVCVYVCTCQDAGVENSCSLIIARRFQRDLHVCLCDSFRSKIFADCCQTVTLDSWAADSTVGDTK